MQNQFQCSCPKLSFAAVIDGELCVSASLKSSNSFRQIAQVKVGRCYRQSVNMASFLSEVSKADPLLVTVSACQKKCRFQSKNEYSKSDRSASDVLSQLLSVLFENEQLAFCSVDVNENEESMLMNDFPSSSSQSRIKSYDGLLQVIGKSTAILYIDINNPSGPSLRRRERSASLAAADDTPTETKTLPKRVTPNSGLTVGTPTAPRRNLTVTSDELTLHDGVDADLDSVGSGSGTTLYSLCQRYLVPERRSRGPSTPTEHTSTTHNVSSTESMAQSRRSGVPDSVASVGMQRSASLSQLGSSTAALAATRQPSLDSKGTPTLGIAPLRNPKKAPTKTTPPLASSSSSSAAAVAGASNSNKTRLPSRGEIQRKALPGQLGTASTAGTGLVTSAAAVTSVESAVANAAAAVEHRRKRDHHIRGELRRLNSSPSIQMLDLSQQSTLTGGSVVSYRSDSSVGSGRAGGYESSDGDKDTAVGTGSETELDSVHSQHRSGTAGLGIAALTPSSLAGFKAGIRHTNAAFYEDKSALPSASVSGDNRLLQSFDEQAMQTPVRGGAITSGVGSGTTPVSSGCGGIALLNSRDMAFLNEMQPDTSFELEAAGAEADEEHDPEDRYHSEDVDFDREGGYFQRDSDDFQLTECNLERFNEDDMLEYSKSSFSRQFASGSNARPAINKNKASNSSVPTLPMRKSKSFSSAPSSSSLLHLQAASPVLSESSRRGATGYQSDDASQLFPDMIGSGSRLSGSSRLGSDSLAYSKSNAAGAAAASSSLNRQQLLLSQSASPQGRPSASGGGLFGFVAKAPTLGEMSGNRQLQQLSPIIATSPIAEEHSRLLDQDTIETPEVAQQAMPSLSEENTQETFLVDVDSILARSESTGEQPAGHLQTSDDPQQQSFAMRPPIGKHQRTTTENSRTSDEHSHQTAASGSSTKTGATPSSVDGTSRGAPPVTAAASGAAVTATTAVSAPRQVDARLKVFEAALNQLPSDLSALMGECILWQRVFPVDCALQLTAHLHSLSPDGLKQCHAQMMDSKKEDKKTAKAKLSRSSMLDAIVVHLVKMLTKLLEGRMGTFVDGIKSYGACAVVLAVFQLQYFTETLLSRGSSMESLRKLKSFRKLVDSFEFALDKSLLAFGSWCLSPVDRLWIVSTKQSAAGGASSSASATAGTNIAGSSAAVDKDRKRRNKSEEKAQMEASSPAVEEAAGPSRFQLLIDFLLAQYDNKSDLAELYAMVKQSVRSRDYNVQILESPVRAPRVRSSNDAAAAAVAVASSTLTSELLVDPDPLELSKLFPDDVSASIDIASIPNSSAEHSKTSFDLDNPTVAQYLAPTVAAAPAPDSKAVFRVLEKPQPTILVKKKTIVNSRVSMGQSKTVSVSVRDLRQQQQQQVIRRASTLPDAASLHSPPRASTKLNAGSPDEIMNTPYSPGVVGSSQSRNTRRRVEDTPLDQQGYRSLSHAGNSSGGGAGIGSVGGSSSNKRPKLTRTTALFGDMLNSPVMGGVSSTPSSESRVIADTPMFPGRSSTQPVEPLVSGGMSTAGMKRSLSQFTAASSSFPLGFSLSGEASDSDGEEFSQRSALRAGSSGSSSSRGAVDDAVRAPSPIPSSGSSAVPLLNAFSMESPRPSLPPTAKRVRALSDGDASSSRFTDNQSNDARVGGVLSTPMPQVPKTLRHTHPKGIAESPLQDSPLAASPPIEVTSATRSGSIFRSPSSSQQSVEASSSSTPPLTTPSAAVVEVHEPSLFLTQASPLIAADQPEHSSILKAPKKKARSPDFSENYLTASGSKVKSLSQPAPSTVAAPVRPPIGRRGRK